MHHEGDALIGIHFLNKEMMPDIGFLYNGEKYNTFDYYIALTPFSWLEMSYVCTERIRAKNDQTGEIQWSKDRSASMKIQPLKEGKYYPAVAIGCNDIATSVFKADQPDVQLYFMNVYLAATKHFFSAFKHLRNNIFADLKEAKTDKEKIEWINDIKKVFCLEDLKYIKSKRTLLKRTKGGKN